MLCLLSASRSALSLSSMPTCDGIHWNSTISSFIICSLITCLTLLTIKHSERCWTTDLMADLELTRIAAFSKDPFGGQCYSRPWHWLSSGQS
ncbi:hypothetical protein NPIL_359041 [Nephila pilipes]|uniref:Uncharacterized protein n=1 Tax=Nephila pilipes TaxID=299642 RepID=A0A8X6T7Y7_NEPPI|nr:hypothetical protein NPIL_359041 [Nephila pilipes]